VNSLFGWLVADGWCWFVLREEYCWLVASGWFVLREKYCWLVADEQAGSHKCSQLVSISKFVVPIAHLSVKKNGNWTNCYVTSLRRSVYCPRRRAKKCSSVVAFPRNIAFTDHNISHQKGK
jgi:hypothetical protein